MRYPRIDLNEYLARRKKVFASLQEPAWVILPAQSLSVRNGDTHYPFRQASDFYYLTGIQEPEAILVLDTAQQETCLFSHAFDQKTARWEGPRLGKAGALAQKLDAWKSLEQFEDALKTYLSQNTRLYYDLGKHPRLDTLVLRCLSERGSGRFAETHFQIQPLAPTIAKLRSQKSVAELDCLQKAVTLSVEGHRLLMSSLRDAPFEYTLAGQFTGYCLSQGASGMAYPPIVASAERACILHYTDNQAKLRAGDLVLVDAGAEYLGYAGDITRTYPIKGVYSKAQATLYDIVLQAQEVAIQALQPGVTWSLLQKKVVNTLVQGLLDARVIQGQLEDWLEKDAYKAFYMHGCGHWLGLDVHDSGPYKTVDGQEWPFLVNQTLTLEPGLYFDLNNLTVDEQYRGIGIRIEDNFLITQTGYTALSAHLPKTRVEIEAEIKTASGL